MKILMVTSEMAPLVKTGGLADVLGALPQALAARGHEVAVALPFYGQIHRSRLQLSLVSPQIVVDLPVGRRGIAVWATELAGVRVYLVEDQALFNRPQLYAENGREYPDNALRYAYFCTAVLWMLKGLGWTPDVIHGHDWQAALIPILLRHNPAFAGDDDLQHPKTLFSIHNLSYQGIFPAHTAAQIGLPPAAMHPDALEFWGSLNLLKGALLYSDGLSTVSPTYAREIQTPAFGCGLEGVIATRADRLTGILNGIDVEDWNPANDPHTAAPYSLANPAGKSACKVDLQRRLGLAIAPRVPLMGIVSRLVDQKGFDLLAAVLPELLERNVQLAVLGTGQPEYHELLTRLAERHPGRVGLKLGFDNALAHQIEAGSDLFLMPSAFEPCGLNQMYSLRYGTLPVVRWTGGLADTIVDATHATLADATANGFVFEQYATLPLAETIARALDLYLKHPKSWRQMIATAMAEDHSWNHAAGQYEALMESL